MRRFLQDFCTSVTGRKGVRPNQSGDSLLTRAAQLPNHDRHGAVSKRPEQAVRTTTPGLCKPCSRGNRGWRGKAHDSGNTASPH